MNLHFIIKYLGLPGESLFLRISGNNEPADIQLEYTGNANWEGNIPVRLHDDRKIKYSIIFKPAENPATEKLLFRKKINLKKYKAETIYLFHESTSLKDTIRLERLKPFSKILRQRNIKKAKKKTAKNPTHIFKLDMPRLQDHIFLCLTGSAKKTGSFNPEKPL